MTDCKLCERSWPLNSQIAFKHVNTWAYKFVLRQIRSNRKNNYCVRFKYVLRTKEEPKFLLLERLNIEESLRNRRRSMRFNIRDFNNYYSSNPICDRW